MASLIVVLELLPSRRSPGHSHELCMFFSCVHHVLYPVFFQFVLSVISPALPSLTCFLCVSFRYSFTPHWFVLIFSLVTSMFDIFIMLSTLASVFVCSCSWCSCCLKVSCYNTPCQIFFFGGVGVDEYISIKFQILPAPWVHLLKLHTMCLL